MSAQSLQLLRGVRLAHTVSEGPSLRIRTEKITMRIALTREVSPSFARCELTHQARTSVDVGLAREQHHAYERCLAELGCTVRRIPAAPELPDAVFVEDTAVVLNELGVVTRPGAASRQPEIRAVAEVLRDYRPLSMIEPPATLDGGDVLCVGRTVYVGRSVRTNEVGVAQLARLLAPLGCTVRAVEVTDCLHLKTAVTQVTERTLLINPRWVQPAVFEGLETIEVDASEPFAANALWLGEVVVYPTAFPRTRGRLEAQGLRVWPVNISELAKAEAGVTCCSLIFRADGAVYQRSPLTALPVPAEARDSDQVELIRGS